ncbi:MAG: hypothetical protein EA362_01735 [Saprospirales bacterium]|nr:MAG: hypothetical protein EA362_01735 [Saprospirales bacterium]
MRFIIILLIIFSSINYASSQVEVSDFTFGFELSPTISWMATDDNRINGNGSNLGLRIGTTGEYYLTENYSLVAGIHFAFNQGGQLFYERGGNHLSRTELSIDLVDGNLPDNVDIRYRMQFLEIPLGFKMRTNQIGNMSYYAQFPVFTFGINTKATADIEGSGIKTENERINQEIPFLRMFWSVALGAEYELGGNTYLVGGLGYQSNFGDIVKGGGTRIDGGKDRSSAKIHSLVIRIGVKF